MNIDFKKLTTGLILPAIIALICTVIAFSPESTSDALRYDANAIKNGEIWRLITAHFVHLSLPHLWLNLGGLLLVFVFFAQCVSIRYWLFCLAANTLLISVLIYFLNPEIIWYVGLSGVLHGLFILGGIADIQHRKWEGIGFTVIILSKVIYEQLEGPLPGSEETAGGPVLVDAHFYGAMTGLVLSIPIIMKLIRKLKKRPLN
ncbi:MAG: rhombosortase [Gammaproteobacteria bacterium]|nr:rhombosortase [Gammaproteobacteria bacterium]